MDLTWRCLFCFEDADADADADGEDWATEWSRALSLPFSVSKTRMRSWAAWSCADTAASCAERAEAEPGPEFLS